MLHAMSILFQVEITFILNYITFTYTNDSVSIASENTRLLCQLKQKRKEQNRTRVQKEWKVANNICSYGCEPLHLKLLKDMPHILNKFKLNNNIWNQKFLLCFAICVLCQIEKWSMILQQQSFYSKIMVLISHQQILKPSSFTITIYAYFWVVSGTFMYMC